MGVTNQFEYKELTSVHSVSTVAPGKKLKGIELLALAQHHLNDEKSEQQQRAHPHVNKEPVLLNEDQTRSDGRQN